MKKEKRESPFLKLTSFFNFVMNWIERENGQRYMLACQIAFRHINSWVFEKHPSAKKGHEECLKKLKEWNLTFLLTGQLQIANDEIKSFILDQNRTAKQPDEVSDSAILEL